MATTTSRFVLARDPWDDRVYDAALGAARALGGAEAAIKGRGDPEGATLVRDLHASFYKLTPTVDGGSAATKHHRDLVEQVMASREYEALRATTRLDPATSALATAVAIEGILAKLPRGSDADARRRAIRDAVAQAGAAVAGAVALEGALGLDGDGPAGLGGSGAARQGGPQGERVARLLALHEAASRSDALRRVADLAGRMTRTILTRHRSRPRHGPDEVHDVTLGDDLSRLLPSELGALATRRPALVGLRREALGRWADRRSMQYDLRSRVPEHKGPIVVVLDESDSMRGSRLEWACALSLALMALARKQKRAFALITHNEAITSERTWPTARATLDDLVAVLSRHAGGGTSFREAFERGLELATEGALRNADLIAVTDGDAPTEGWGPEWRERATSADVRLWALLLGVEPGESRLTPLADGVACVRDLSRDDAALTLVSGF